MAFPGQIYIDRKGDDMRGLKALGLKNKLKAAVRYLEPLVPDGDDMGNLAIRNIQDAIDALDEEQGAMRETPSIRPQYDPRRI